MAASHRSRSPSESAQNSYWPPFFRRTVNENDCAKGGETGSETERFTERQRDTVTGTGASKAYRCNAAVGEKVPGSQAPKPLHLRPIQQKHALGVRARAVFVVQQNGASQHNKPALKVHTCTQCRADTHKTSCAMRQTVAQNAAQRKATQQQQQQQQQQHVRTSILGQVPVA